MKVILLLLSLLASNSASSLANGSNPSKSGTLKVRERSHTESEVKMQRSDIIEIPKTGVARGHSTSTTASKSFAFIFSPKDIPDMNCPIKQEGFGELLERIRTSESGNSSPSRSSRVETKKGRFSDDDEEEEEEDQDENEQVEDDLMFKLELSDDEEEKKSKESS